MEQIGLYYPVGDNGYQRIGGFTVDSSGHAVLEVADSEFRDELAELTAGVAPRSIKQLVVPAQGTEFLDALAEHFANSSYWRIVDETDRL